jgi:cysteine desulfurase/selenocysteine lyase
MTAQTKIATSFDPIAARADFAILSRTVYGKPLVYLDNAASAQKPRQVLEAMTKFAESEYANVHRGVHYLSAAATDRYEAARETARRFLNAAHSDEIVFTKGGTEAINLVSYSFAAPRIQPGDEIVLTVMEHHSNIVPWHFLRERHGAVLKWVDLRDDGSLDAEAVDAAIGPKTKLVAVSHMSNVLGTLSPLKEIVARAHAKGVPVLADGCQGAVHEIVDVRDLDVDFYVVTGHKLYGPTGIGVLWGRYELLADMPPFLGGGEMIRDVSTETVTYSTPPHRFEAGTPPIVEAAGLAAALRYMETIGRARIAAHEESLRVYAEEQLSRVNSVRIFGRAPGKGAIVSFNMEGAHAHDVATILDRYGVAVRAGTHCTQPLLARFGVTSTLRASFGMYNTVAEIDRLAEAVQKAHEFFG